MRFFSVYIFVIIFLVFSPSLFAGNPASTLDLFVGPSVTPEYSALEADLQGIHVVDKKGWGRFFLVGFQTRRVSGENLICPNIYSLRVGLNLQWKRGGIQAYGGFQPGLLFSEEEKAMAWVSGFRYWNISEFKHVEIAFHYSHRDEYTYGYGNLDFVLMSQYPNFFMGPHLELESNKRAWGGWRVSARIDSVLIGFQGRITILSQEQKDVLETPDGYTDPETQVLPGFSIGFFLSLYDHK